MITRGLSEAFGKTGGKVSEQNLERELKDITIETLAKAFTCWDKKKAAETKKAKKKGGTPVKKANSKQSKIKKLSDDSEAQGTEDGPTFSRELLQECRKYLPQGEGKPCKFFPPNLEIKATVECNECKVALCSKCDLENHVGEEDAHTRTPVGLDTEEEQVLFDTHTLTGRKVLVHYEDKGSFVGEILGRVKGSSQFWIQMDNSLQYYDNEGEERENDETETSHKSYFSRARELDRPVRKKIGRTEGKTGERKGGTREGKENPGE